MPPAPPPHPPAQPVTNATQRFLDAFNQNGLLTKVTSCHGEWCKGESWEHGHEWINRVLESTTLPPPVEADCGEWCAAFSFVSPEVPFVPFGFFQYHSGLMLAFNASDAMWDQVQCMSVTDSFTSARACCTCNDRQNCPFQTFTWWGFEDPGYCEMSADSCTSDVCKQLAAGCGVNLFDIAGQANVAWAWQEDRVGREGSTDWLDQSCTENEVASGMCPLCTVPMWCDDPDSSIGFKSSIRTPEDWIDEFFDRDGGPAYGARQCKYKPDQRKTFVDTMNLRFTRRSQLPIDFYGRHYDHANTWNEVNMYVDPDQAALAQLLWDNLIGLVFVRTAGDDDELSAMRNLAAHWRELGRDVPMFAMDAEELETVTKWQPGKTVNLLTPEYNLHQIF